MRPKVKHAVIYRHREEYPVSVMCKFFRVSRSGYYDFVKRMGQPEHDADLAKEIEECQNRTDKTYGYRRVWKWLKDRNIEKNPKTVLRVMKKYGLLSEIRRRRKWVNLGQQVHKYENLLARQFRADRPNAKWVTDISYIHTKEGVLYLSMIRDLYDNSIVAYKTATQQTVSLVLDTIRLAMEKEKKRVAAELQLHSDQGFQYTSQGYFNLTQSYGITPSMSRKGIQILFWFMRRNGLPRFQIRIVFTLFGSLPVTDNAISQGTQAFPKFCGSFLNGRFITAQIKFHNFTVIQGSLSFFHVQRPSS